MNSIQYHIKQNGVWQKLNATPVFPFSIGELLDERLDEAYLTIYDSLDEHIPRLTEIMATIQNGDKTKQEFFIVASDTSVELPAGSGKYKHDIYLIERTKLLEGIYCSSLTFTNALPRDYSVVLSRVSPENMNNMQPLPVGFYGYPSITSPRLNTTDYIVPTPRDVGSYLAEIHNEEETGSIAYTPYSTTYQAYSSVTIYLDNEYLSESTENAYTITADLLSKSKNLTLVYVIYVSRIILGTETQYAFEFKFDIGLYSNRLPLKRWSITDCITRCCELAEPLFGSEKPKYRLDGVEYDNDGNVIKPYTVGSLAEKYDKVFAPEFTLTQDTLREQLRTILSFVHAEPWLNENDVICVEEYGNTTVSTSEGLPYVYSSGRSHINEYCTEIRSHAQNLASSLGYAKGTMIDPGNGLYRSLRTETAYARINEDNGIAKTVKPIYSIDKVMCGIAPANQSPGMTWWLDPVDITPYVFEATEYGANLSPYKGGFPYSRAYAIYYTQGQPNIQGLFYKAPDNVSAAQYSPFSISNILASVTGRNVSDIDDELVQSAANLVFSITYKPISNHFISHGKSLYVKGETPFMQLYNQTENLVESQYYGEHIKGVAARLGNVEEERTFILKDIDDIPHVGQMLDEYAISAVSTEFYPFDMKCTVGLSKDFNRISEYVGINSAKRMYEVSERQATQRDILYKETLVIGEKPSGYMRAGKMFNNLAPIYTLFDSDVTNGGDWCISFAILHTEKKNGTKLNEVCLPVIGRALGNVLTFNFATKDNYSAGDSTLLISGAEDISGRWQTDVPYTDYYGRAWGADIFLKTRFDGTLYDQISDAFNIPQAFPSGNYLYLDGHRLRKDNRETLSYNLELEIKTTDPNLIIGSALAELSGWVNDTDVSPELYFFDAEEYSVSKFDKQYTPHDDDIRGYDYGSSVYPSTSLWSITNEADGTLNFRTVGQRINGHGVGFVLCTPIETVTETVEDDDGFEMEVSYQTGGDILLANNGPFAFGETISYDFYVTKN